MKYNNIDYQRCVLICMVVMIHIVNFSTLYPDVKNFINFFFMQAFLLITGYLVNIRKTYKEFASYIMKIIIPYNNGYRLCFCINITTSKRWGERIYNTYNS